MSIYQKQADFGRSIFEINQNTIQEIARLTQENVKGYFELNSDFGKKIPEVTSLSTLVELQREYGTALWNGVKDATRNQTEVLKTAVTETCLLYTSPSPRDS